MWKEQYKAASKKGNNAPNRPEDELEEPTLPRLIVNDATFEAMHQTVSENPAGILDSWIEDRKQEYFNI